MITRGSSLSMTSKRQRRVYARQIHHVTTYPATSPPRYAEIPITFGPKDARVLYFPHQDPLVIFASIADFEVRRVLVDEGSSAYLLFADAFDKMMIPRMRQPTSSQNWPDPPNVLRQTSSTRYYMRHRLHPKHK